MVVRLCVLVVFVTSVCQGAAAPSQRLDCLTDALNNDCIECVCKTGGAFQRCSPKLCIESQFSERRKRQVEAQLVDETSTQSVSTEAEPQVENSTSAVSTSAAPPPSSEVIPSLPPPPHPSAAQETAVKPRSCKSGSTWEEECNTCWCLDNGMAACTVKRCEILSPVAATKTTTTTASPSEMSAPSTSTSVQSPPVESPTALVESPTTSVQSQTTSEQSQTTAVQESSVLPTSPTTSVQSSTSVPVSSTSPSGGTS